MHSGGQAFESLSAQLLASILDLSIRLAFERSSDYNRPIPQYDEHLTFFQADICALSLSNPKAVTESLISPASPRRSVVP